MKKLKGTFVFCIIFLIILIIDLIFYKNIDKLVPTMDKKIYSFENINKKSTEDFILDMLELSTTQNNFKELKSFDEIKSNEIIYNLIKNYIFKGYNEEEILEWNVYSAELPNTVYGNLKVISITQDEYSYLITYSEDTKKVFYTNADILSGIFNRGDDLIVVDSDYSEYSVENFYTDNLISEKNKAELINKGKNAFSNIIKECEFNPGTIMNNDNYYILKDTERNITVYYNVERDEIGGFYMGFDQ